MRRIFIANRGEIAVRIARAVRDMGLAAVAVFASDDAESLHCRAADQAVALAPSGPAAYLDIELLLATARDAGCDAVHPGYGFLSERADFARACAAAGLVFIGPSAEQLDIFGDKARSRQLARNCEVALLPGTTALAEPDQAREFMASLGANASVMIKAVAGGGGRGLRVVHAAADLPAAFARCRSEALAAFGNGAVLVEQWLPRARHIEIQILGDGREVIALGERECSLQRRHQKLVEIAPSPSLPADLRQELVAAARRMAAAVGYRGLGTFEFLVDTDPAAPLPYAFLEVNPRLQVEHTVTEAVTGVDLVQAQIALAAGRSLADLGLPEAAVRPPRGYAIQLRINAELPDELGGVRPAGGRLEIFRPASGPGVRVDTHAHAGYTLPTRYDSLLAKLMVHSPSADYAAAVRRAARALDDFEIAGIDCNQAFLAELLARPEFVANRVDTGFIERHAVALVAGMQARRPTPSEAGDASVLPAPMAGRLVQLEVGAGDTVRRGQSVAVLESMKMEHPVLATHAGVVTALAVAAGDVVNAGQALLHLRVSDDGQSPEEIAAVADLDAIRPDLAAVRRRHAFGEDASRPAAVAKRHAKGMRTARENIADLVDPGSFVEYGALAIAAQRRRRAEEELIRETPADGLVAGIGSINGAAFGAERARAMVLAYDYTVLAGTQGMMNHKKTDRLLHLAEDWRLPIVLFAEGGGGRPGDTDVAVVAGLDVPTFASWARLSGKLPRLGIVAGHCFAGNAAVLGCSDVIIATANSSIGMGGPAMIEGGGLGVCRPEEVGPSAVHRANGVIDVAVADEAAAVAAARRYLAYFQGRTTDWQAGDVRLLRHLIPENRLRSYEIRGVIGALCDTGSVLELRAGFGHGIVTALVRVEGRPLGLIANNPRHLSGAIDADAADKAARFMQLCDAFGLPLLSLCDTPGFMVGPEVEKTAQVRHVSRMFVIAGSLSVPIFTVVLRKGYGLGAMAMAGGSFHRPVFTAAWPTGEFGGMGLEGAVRLGYRKELEAIADPLAREAHYRELVAQQYAKGQAMNMASMLEIDAVIDPAQTRQWILRGLAALPATALAGSRRCIDAW